MKISSRELRSIIREELLRETAYAVYRELPKEYHTGGRGPAPRVYDPGEVDDQAALVKIADMLKALRVGGRPLTVNGTFRDPLTGHLYMVYTTFQGEEGYSDYLRR
jgi:hypothetical protein